MASTISEKVDTALGQNQDMGTTVKRIKKGEAIGKPWLPSTRAGDIIKKVKGYSVPTRGSVKAANVAKEVESIGRRANPRGGSQ